MLFNKWDRMKFMDADGSGGGGNDPAGGTDGNGGSGGEDKTFTQEQVNSMIAAEKRKNLSSVYKNLGFESEEDAKAFIGKYKDQEEKNKSDLEKEQQKSKQLAAEKKAADQKAQDLQYKFDAMAEGCDAKAAEDVVVLAKAKMSDDKDFAAALKEIKEQYPAMFGQSDDDYQGGTGSGGTSARKRSRGKDISGIGKRLAEQTKKANATKNNEYFK